MNWKAISLVVLPGLWLAPAACGDAFYTFAQRSAPQGIIAGQSGLHVPGTSLHTVNAPLESSGYSFGYWTLNDQRSADALGQALTISTFTLVSNTTAIAWYFPTTQDTNSDGIPDYFQWRYYGSLTNGTNSDTDADGFVIADELTRGYSPVIADALADGGIMMRVDDAATYRSEAQMKSYQIRSDPPGIFALQTGYTNTSSAVATPTVTYGANSGYDFGYWEVNGVRQTDGAGTALPRVLLPMTNDVVAIARFFPAGDSNTNGLEDWYEWYWFGNLNQTSATDPDADGFVIADELTRGYSPVIADALADGGIMMRMSDVGTVGLSYYPRVTQVLANGIMGSGFVAAGGAAGTLGVSSNSAPALGDWNGDGVPDLVVGGANGRLRFYPNNGSPIVPNFVEDTVSATTLASSWTNLENVAPALGDWSGDGVADLVIGGTSNLITLIGSVGGFSNMAPGRIISSLTVANTTLTIPALARTAGNPRCDLYVLRDNGTVDRFLNTGIPTAPFSATNRIADVLGTAVSRATGLAVEDMNNDGFVDVLVADTTGSIFEFRGGSNQTFAFFGAGFAGSYSGFANRLTLGAGDLFGDGDIDLIGGFAEGGLVYLKNPTRHLLISPPSVTVAAGQTTVFSTLNASGQVNWKLSRAPSGGVINPTNGSYQSGLTGGSMDFIEAVDSSGLRGRAYANVIGTNELASFGKAIVIAGGRDLNDPVWLASDYIANKAYNVLRYKGYARDNIHYLSFDSSRDVDGDGLTNDIAGFSSFANVSGTFTNWVGHANRLFVYLVDHGSATPDGAYFRLNTGENLTSVQLNAWLTAIQNQYQTEVVVVLDFCYAGRFVQDLAYAGQARRVVIAATTPTELTYFLSGGLVSFSDLFLSGLLEGLDLQQVFLFARDGMQGYQNPIMDDTGDGIYQANVDGAFAAQIPIGATHLAGKDIPVIGAVAASQTLSTSTKATLWANGIQSYYPIQNVYCTILPPSFRANTNAGVPVTGVSEVTLTPDVSGRYQASFEGFTEAGAYKIYYYARDIWGSVSPPQQGLVIQAGFDERMVLVVGGATNDAEWAAVANMAGAAYQTALARRLGKGSLRCLSAAASQDLDGDGTNDAAGASSLANLGQAITNWAAGANKLTIYLLGSTTTNGLFRLNATESLGTAQLDGWLDGFQSSNRSVIVLMDFDGSGGYVPSLTAPNGRERIVLASTKAGTKSLRAAGGLVSFSQFFLSGIFNGGSLGTAFNDARDAIRSASGRVRQTAALDDNGNGLANEKNADGILAAQRYLGAAFATGEDSPFIGEVTPPSEVVTGTPVLLWASDILDVAGISNVWCVITPPDYDGLGDLPQTNLTWNASAGRYEVLYTNFAKPGTHVCTFFARNNSGLLSSAKQSEVTVTDSYETDDSSIQATIFPLGDTQQHNFHSSTDEDWVKFYAPTGIVFEIKALQRSTNSDLQLEFYHEQPDGSLELIDWADSYGVGSNITESLTLDLKTGQSGRLPGLYLVRVSSYDTNLSGPGSEYDLQIYVPIGGAGGVPFPPLSPWLPTLAVGSFYVFLGPQPALAAGGWRITQVTNEIYFSGDPVIYLLPASPDYTLSFRDVPGYRAPTNRSLVITADQTTSVMAYYTYTNLSPRAYSAMTTTNGAFQLTLLACAGKRYAIEESTNLLHWMPLLTNQAPQDGLLHLTRTNLPAKPRAFYRARLVP